jgi:hypothetical protein
VPNGSIELQLNIDGTVIAAPYGFVAASVPAVFQFDANGALIQPAKIWSNLELQPQNSMGIGTYYLVTFFDQNGAILNINPLLWQFQEIAGSTVDISTMTPYQTEGNVIFYPVITPVGMGMTSTIAFGTAVLGTALIASGAKAATVTVSAPGVLATDNVLADFSVDPTSTTGYIPSASGMLTIIKFATAGAVNFVVVNNTGASITPGAVTLDWRVVR